VGEAAAWRYGSIGGASPRMWFTTDCFARTALVCRCWRSLTPLRSCGGRRSRATQACYNLLSLRACRRARCLAGGRLMRPTRDRVDVSERTCPPYAAPRSLPALRPSRAAVATMRPPTSTSPPHHARPDVNKLEPYRLSEADLLRGPPARAAQLFHPLLAPQ
jgi:hypothetical protein